MASLSNCKDCGHAVSKKAQGCPNCGAPIRKQSSNSGCTSVLVLAFLVVGYMVLTQSGDDETYPASDARPTATPSDRKSATMDPGRIRQLQQSLGTIGYDVGPADGLIGRRTETAIRKFQSDNSLPVTGKPDAQFLSALADAHERSLAIPASSVRNKTHSILAGMSESERARNLGIAINSSEHSCAGPHNSYFQGFDADDAAYWNITCSNGAKYTVQVSADRGGSTKIMDCSLMSYLGLECYKQLE